MEEGEEAEEDDNRDRSTRGDSHERAAREELESETAVKRALGDSSADNNDDDDDDNDDGISPLFLSLLLLFLLLTSMRARACVTKDARSL